MADRVILAQCILRSTSGLPTDAFVTDWVFKATADQLDVDLAPDIAALLNGSFWNFSDGTNAPCGFLSEALSDTVTVNAYDLTGHLDGSNHGSPVSTATFSLGTHDNVGILPEECAVALSFHGDLTGIPERSGATRPAARHRGRVFLGPWAQAAVAGPVGGHAYVTIGLQNTLVSAAAELLTDAAAADLPWQVWSRANATTYDVVGGFLDNAWDTIRSRGADPSGRVLWP